MDLGPFGAIGDLGLSMFWSLQQTGLGTKGPFEALKHMACMGFSTFGVLCTFTICHTIPYYAILCHTMLYYSINREAKTVYRYWCRLMLESLMLERVTHSNKSGDEWLKYR